MLQHANPELILGERYEVTEVIEPGKYGAAIFVAFGYERSTGEPVFMKAKDHDASGHVPQRVYNEANHLESLDHPQIARVVEADPSSYYPYLVTRRMPGGLEPYEWLKDNPNHPMAAEICLSALEALRYVHEKGMVHRDVKGTNMSMRWSGWVALNDFELALDSQQRRARQDPEVGDVPEDAAVTGDGRIVGTATHISPEQLAGREASELSDLYAMGVTLYRLVYGHLPFQGKTDEVMRQRMCQDINFWPEGRQAPGQLRLIIEKATQENPGDRYQSAEEMSEDIERYLRSLTG
ncbi:MAG TPA: serine/threonine-protein kinase [Candidatus Saccharimonadales bacterium]|nr:serine/threonine-protein kinase [Candidatus Saccharimonadales bacterium]